MEWAVCRCCLLSDVPHILVPIPPMPDATPAGRVVHVGSYQWLIFTCTHMYLDIYNICIFIYIIYVYI